MRHFGPNSRTPGLPTPDKAHLWPRYALYVQPSHGAHTISPSPCPFPAQLPRPQIHIHMAVPAPAPAPAPVPRAGLWLAKPLSSTDSPLALSAWQKLFKILLLAATSKCQVFTITLLLLLQFYLILMGFFLPPTAECIKQGQSIRERITHERASLNHPALLLLSRRNLEWMEQARSVRVHPETQPIRN